MTKFISLSSKSHQDKLLSVDKISVIQEVPLHVGAIEPVDAVCLYHETEGEIGRYIRQDLSDEALETLKDLIAPDHNYISLPIRIKSTDAEPQTFLYINPNVIQSLILSEKRKEGGDGEEYMAIQMTIKGFGEIKSTYLKPSEMEHIVSLIDKPMFYIDGDMVTTSFDHTFFIMQDTDQISHIYSDTEKALNVVFNDASRLRFAPKENKDVSPDEADLEPLHQIASHIAEQIPEMEDVAPIGQVFFTRLDNVKKISRDRERLCFEYARATRKNFNEKLYVSCSTPEKAKTVIQRFLGLKN